MRIAARYWHAGAAVLLVLAPLVLLRAARTEEAQQELFGINPERLILYAPADTGELAIPRH